MCLELMNKILEKLKLVVVVSSLSALMLIVACSQQFQEPFDAEEQLEIDIDLIEGFISDYRKENGLIDYDTLDREVRALVLEEGNGEAIEPNDIISYHYIGKFLSLTDTLFDTSIRQLAYDQDLRNIIDTTFQTNSDGSIKLDSEGNKMVSKINYKEGYVPIFSVNRTYTSAKTTHTSTGWRTEQVLSGTVEGYPLAVNFALFNCRLGGRALAILPSQAAYGRLGSGLIPPNTVIMFEIRPVQKR